MHELPIPGHFDPSRVGEVWRVPYEDRAREAQAWADEHALGPAAEDGFRLCLLAVDVQNTFCIPGFELFVGGPLGLGRGRRQPPPVRVDLPQPRLGHAGPRQPRHPPRDAGLPRDLARRRARAGTRRPTRSSRPRTSRRGAGASNAAVAEALGIDPDYARRHLAHYTRRLAEGGKYDLTVWPYHAMLGGIGHALVSAVEEAIFFHGVARHSRPDFHVKGDHPLTEHYSVLGPEVTEGPDGDPLADEDPALHRHPPLLRRGGHRRAGEEPLRRLDDRRPPRARRDARAGRSAPTSSRTAPLRSSSRASWTTPTRPTPPSSATWPPGCTSCAPPTRSRPGRASPSGISRGSAVDP